MLLWQNCYFDDRNMRHETFYQWKRKQKIQKTFSEMEKQWLKELFTRYDDEWLNSVGLIWKESNYVWGC